MADNRPIYTQIYILTYVQWAWHGTVYDTITFTISFYIMTVISNESLLSFPMWFSNNIETNVVDLSDDSRCVISSENLQFKFKFKFKNLHGIWNRVLSIRFVVVVVVHVLHSSIWFVFATLIPFPMPMVMFHFCVSIVINWIWIVYFFTSCRLHLNS